MNHTAVSVDATPLGNINTGIVLLTLWPILFGVVDTTAMVAVLPWALMALPLVLLTSVVAFQQGNVLGAVANGILSGLTLCQNAVWGLVVMVYTAAGAEIPAAVTQAKGYVDGTAFTATAFMLLCVTLTFAKLHNYPMALFMGIIGVGFFCMGMSDLGIVNLRLPAALCVVSFASWMLYSGCAMLVHHVLGRKILPY